MLQNLSEAIARVLSSFCSQKGSRILRYKIIDMERRWIALAHSYEFYGNALGLHE
jgi:hypothetical protein